VAGGSGGQWSARSNPVVFEHGRSIGTTLVAWPVEQVVKCLVSFHPDDDVDNRLENEAQVKALYDAVQASGHELLLEIVPPKHLPRTPDTLLRALKRLYNLGIFPEWWKLPPPAHDEWPALDALIAERDPYCRGVVLRPQRADRRAGAGLPTRRAADSAAASRSDARSSAIRHARGSPAADDAGSSPACGRTSRH
jgi:5-dehydro-2-deoxygluconokinase